jgi:hypothetical protein
VAWAGSELKIPHFAFLAASRVKISHLGKEKKGATTAKFMILGSAQPDGFV